ncbi:hypothetical protein [Streptomyces sp. NBC_01198]|uniref:hypothetical protein n=1 Tax=Streptomyces sp. NBC_01198 TaxID=2903769 RepID=UPI002E0F0990|nr:hypothetical protein OG702_19545 [Streptomyces sp. NBC_01198]
MRTSLKALAVALVILSSACAHGVPTEGTRSGHASPVPGGTSLTRTIRLPLDAYTLSNAEQALVDNAQDELTGDCMRTHGFRWPALRRSAPDMIPVNSRRYGITDLADAQKYGYRLNPRQAADVDAVRKQSAQLSPAQKTTGSSCARKAYDRLHTGVAEVDFTLWNTVNKSSFEQARDSAVVASAIHAWSRCMHRSGFDFPDPLAAVNDPAFSSGADASPHEVDVAAADAACKESTALTTAWSTAERRIQQKLIAARPGYFDSVKKENVTLVAAAHRILPASNG